MDLVRDILARGDFDIDTTKDGSSLTALHDTALLGEPAIVQMLLEHDGVEINATDSSGQTALFYSRNPSATEVFLAHPDVKVDHIDHDGRTALSCAAEDDLLGRAHVLLQNGARPDLKGLSGYTPYPEPLWL
jgi:ankyrin repeat protein